MKTIGLLGGMSWESTASYYEAINEGVKQALGGLPPDQREDTDVVLAATLHAFQCLAREDLDRAADRHQPDGLRQRGGGLLAGAGWPEAAGGGPRGPRWPPPPRRGAPPGRGPRPADRGDGAGRGAPPRRGYPPGACPRRQLYGCAGPG